VAGPPNARPVRPLAGDGSLAHQRRRPLVHGVTHRAGASRPDPDHLVAASSPAERMDPCACCSARCPERPRRRRPGV